MHLGGRKLGLQEGPKSSLLDLSSGILPRGMGFWVRTLQVWVFCLFQFSVQVLAKLGARTASHPTDFLNKPPRVLWLPLAQASSTWWAARPTSTSPPRYPPIWGAFAWLLSSASLFVGSQQHCGVLSQQNRYLGHSRAISTLYDDIMITLPMLRPCFATA